jgi:endonuclease III
LTIGKKTAITIIDRLVAAHGETRQATGLVHEDPYQLIVSVILSAQCTDKRVNMITPLFFRRFADFAQLSRSDLADIEGLIRSVGLYHHKALALQRMARHVEAEYGGSLPADRDLLMKIPGVGRKSANVILAVLFDMPALAVDTHVARVARRIGFSSEIAPDKIEADLTRLFPPQLWHTVHRALIWHGRKVCKARKPSCEKCMVWHNCAYYRAQRPKKVKRISSRSH